MDARATTSTPGSGGGGVALASSVPSGAVAGARPRVWNGCVPPPYKRERLPAVERRHGRWRLNAYRALDGALEAGELSRGAYTVVHSVLKNSNEHGKDCWPAWVTIGRQARWSARTAGVYLAEARAAGWLIRQHRWRRLADGSVVGMSNIWRVVVPPAALIRLQQQATTVEERAKQGATPVAPQNRPRTRPSEIGRAHV